MKRNYKILTIILLVIIVLIGYFVYIQYNITQTQNILKSSQELKNNATTYFDQAVNYEKQGDYSNAIQAYQHSRDNISQALHLDKQAQNYASGILEEYLNVDIQLLEKTSKLLEYKIYQNQYNNNSLNQGQEKVSPSILAPYIDNLTAEVAGLKEKEEQIRSAHTNEFRFLD